MLKRSFSALMAACLLTAAIALPASAQQSGGAAGDGMLVVGTDIQPGTYRSMAGPGCYWERLRGFGGTLAEIVANDNASGPAVVTIGKTDRAFQSSGCGTWSGDMSSITSDPTQSFGDGTYVVGVDIAPGLWRSVAGSGCYWQRMRGFTGSLNDIIANDNASGQAVVQIGATDKGFSSSGCGPWQKVG